MTYIPVELHRLVTTRAGNCCEYCRLSQEDSSFTFHIEHVIAEKHGGATAESNLCLSCPECNTFKGSDIASLDYTSGTGVLTLLFNPRGQHWDDHFRLNGSVIEALTPEGRVTITILQMNRPEALVERDVFIKLGTYPGHQHT
jgi:HNH endonuclease